MNRPASFTRAFSASVILSGLLLGACLHASFAQASDQDSEIIVLPAGGNLLCWNSKEGRTYFIQASTDLIQWQWSDLIEVGEGQTISHEFGSTSGRAFFRLVYTDSPRPQGVTPEDWDADDDGLTNYQEIAVFQTHPLDSDTSNDGIPDGWAAFFGLNPLVNNAAGLFPGSSTVTNLAAYSAGVQPLANAHPGDYDGDGIPNENDLTPTDRDESRVIVDSTLLQVSREQGTEDREITTTSSKHSLELLFLRYPTAGVIVGIAEVNHDEFGGTLQTARVKIEAVESSDKPRKVKLVHILDNNAPSFPWGTPDITVKPMLEFIVPAGETESQEVSIDPGVTDLTTETPDLNKRSYLIHADIMPDEGQSGVIGGQIESTQGIEGEKHFVSPKQTEEITRESVVLKVCGLNETLFDALFEWDGGTEVAGSTLKRKIARGTPDKFPVNIKLKNDSLVADTMNVWIVWAEVQIVQNLLEPTFFSLHDGSWSGIRGTAADSAWQFKFSIQPAELFSQDPQADVPALSGSAETLPPGGEETYSAVAHLNPDDEFGDTADKKWDVSRQIEIKVINPNLIPLAQFDDDFPFLKPGQPVVQSTPLPFPQDSAQGNDDPDYRGDIPIIDEDANPYAAVVADGLTHDVGEISSFDAPIFKPFAEDPAAGSTLAQVANFREFARLEIKDYRKKFHGTRFWYRISDYQKWHHVWSATFGESYPGSGNFVWKDNSSSSGSSEFEIPNE